MTPPNQPFRARPKRDFLTHVDLNDTIQRATTAHNHGDTVKATETLRDLRRRAIESYGLGHPNLDLIDNVLRQVSGEEEAGRV
jgi:hypothetical protein